MLTLFCLKVFPGNKFLNWKPPWELLTLIGFTVKHQNILHLIDRTNRFEFGGFYLLMTKKKGHHYLWRRSKRKYDSWKIKSFSQSFYLPSKHLTRQYTAYCFLIFLKISDNQCYSSSLLWTFVIFLIAGQFSVSTVKLKMFPRRLVKMSWPS